MNKLQLNYSIAPPKQVFFRRRKALGETGGGRTTAQATRGERVAPGGFFLYKRFFAPRSAPGAPSGR
jgi:hypothetical protein